MPIRIITTHLEFEGETEEKRVVVEGDEPPPWPAEAALRQVGQPLPRVDARERVSGSAVYTADLVLPGMLHGAVVRSPHPHARAMRVAAEDAERLPGVHAIFTPATTRDLISARGRPILAAEALFAGAEVAFVVADSRAAAEAAAARVQVEYEPLPFVVAPEAALAPGAPAVETGRDSNSIGDDWPHRYARGDSAAGLAAAQVVIEHQLTTPAALHNCMETHGGVAAWDGRTLTVWCSTQALFDTRQELCRALGLQQNQVEVICEYMGGGFGSKLGTHAATLLAAYAALRLSRPVKYLLDRVAENLCAGNRAPTRQTYRLGATRDGTLTAIELRTICNVGAQGSWFPSIALPAKELYQCDNVRTVDVPARTNLGTQSAFRAPGVVEGMAGLETAMDALAARLGLDPLVLRQRNYAAACQLTHGPYAAKTLAEAYELGAARIGWATRDDESRRFPQGRLGALRVGVGMASQLWGGDGGPPAQATARVLPDGSAIVVTGTQDIGTGTRTALAQIAAEELGLSPAAVRVELGNTAHGAYSPASGGSMTLASVGPAVRMAAVEARHAVLDIVGHLAEAPADALDIRDGVVVNRETGRAMGTLASFLERLDGHEVSGRGYRGPNAEDVTVRTFGAQFAEVAVDIATGVVRVRRVVAVHDCGRIINPLTFGSQIEGGIIQGLGFALMERRVVDQRLGTVVNPMLEAYLVPTIRDVPEIEIIAIGAPEPRANTLGALGAGEPPIIPTAAAIANAVGHALGRPISELPLTPERVLALVGEGL